MGFKKEDFGYLSEIFAMARVHTVNGEPTNRKQLENIMNFEAVIGSKMIAANEELGYVEPVEEEESQGDEVGEDTATDPGQTD